MREIRSSGSEGGVADNGHPYPYLLEVGWVEREGSDSGTHDPDKPSDSV